MTHLSSQDGNRVLATESAFLSSKHGTTESVVIFERRRAERVCYANPLRYTVVSFNGIHI